MMTLQSRELAERIAAVRREFYGEHGVPLVAEALGIPTAAWRQYERGVTLPAPLVLQFQVLTGASAGWLLTGEGEKYASAPLDGRALRLRPSSPVQPR